MSFTLSSILPPGIDTNHLHDMVWQPKASLNNIQHREQEKRDTNSPLTKCKCHVSCFMTHNFLSDKMKCRRLVALIRFIYQISDGRFTHSRKECFMFNVRS